MKNSITPSKSSLNAKDLNEIISENRINDGKIMILNNKKVTKIYLN